MGNSFLNNAKLSKNDEFYTTYSDIENEVRHYTHLLENKVIYLNCDNPEWSNFYLYFKRHFKEFKLNRLITSHYSVENKKLFWETDKTNRSYTISLELKDNSLVETRTELKGDGDFRSTECIELLKQADIVITNPPFSLFCDLMKLLVKYNKQYLLIFNMNAITYKSVFPLIRDGKAWLGYGFEGGATYFINRHYDNYSTQKEHKDTHIRVSGVHWLTNLPNDKRNTPLKLKRYYYGGDTGLYSFIYGHNIINIDKVVDIPADFEGVMAVPISFLDKHCESQFEILDYLSPTIGDRNVYKRLLIKNKKPDFSGSYKLHRGEMKLITDI